MKLKKNTVLTTAYIFAILPFVGIGGLSNLIGNTAYQGFQVVSVLICIIIFISKKSLKFDFFSICFALYEMEIFLVTTYNHGFSFGVLTSCLVASLFVFLMISDCENILKAISIITAVIVIINFISVIKIGRDDYAMYFVGTKNRLSMVLIPAMLLRVVYVINKYGKINFFTVILFIISTVSVIIAGSGTGIVVATLAIVLMVVFYKLKISKKMVLCGILIVYFLLIVCSNVLSNNQYWIALTAFLGKDSNLTYRTDIWKAIFNALKSSPLFGLGRGSEIMFLNAYGGYNVVREAHNFIMEIFLEGGIIAFVLYSVGFIKAVCHINTKDLKGKYVLLTVVIVLVNGLTESINNHLLIVISIALANNYVYIKSCNSKYLY